MFEQLFNKDAARELSKRLARIEKQQRMILRMLQQQRWASSDLYASEADRQAYGVHSQGGEDGLLLHLLSAVGAPRKSFVEIGIQDGLECNTANLAFHFGWRGVMFEGGEAYARAARKNLSRCRGVRVKQAFVTAENVNALFDETGADREADVFSLDIDGNDYWIWKALEDFRPRVAVVEYNPFFGAEAAVSIPYDPGFVYRSDRPRGYFGASLQAFVKLGASKGYALAGGSSQVSNAFFVRRELLKEPLREVEAGAVFLPSHRRHETPELMDALARLPRVEV
ncbi:MAG: hypothetical protein M5U26_19515 [Planctomycetota bacterium]|nr:hypothetical protein [Planctomycetota bacterium]